MAKLLNLYLPPCPYPDKGKYEIFRDGKRTGEIITNVGVRELLSREQYRKFLNGEDIFYVPAEKFRTRNHRRKSEKTKSIKLK